MKRRKKIKTFPSFRHVLSRLNEMLIKRVAVKVRQQLDPTCNLSNEKVSFRRRVTDVKFFFLFSFIFVTNPNPGWFYQILH